MADNQGERGSPKRQPPNQGLPQNTSSQTGHHENLSSSVSFNQQNTAFSQTQEPWSVLWYWMSAQYYQQYYYQLCSYMYYWQTIASHPMYQGASQPQSGYYQPGSASQGSQAAYGGQQLRQTAANANNQPPPNNGVGIFPGLAVPWAFPGQQPVTTGNLFYIAM